MNVAVIGCGAMGTVHARNVRRLGHRPVLVDPNAQRRFACAPELGSDVPRLESISAALGMPGDPVGAAMVCTPAVTHAVVTTALRTAGYAGPLFVEKPLATSLQEADTFRAWPHPTTMVGYMLRFDPLLRVLHEQRDVVGCDFSVHHDMREWGPSKYPMWRWLECSHELDLALWLGAPSAAAGASGPVLQLGPRWRIRVEASPAPFSRSWTVRTPDMDVTLAFGTARAGAEGMGGLDQWLQREMYRAELEHFLACAAAGRETAVPFPDGIRVLNVLVEAGLQRTLDDSGLEV